MKERIKGTPERWGIAVVPSVKLLHMTTMIISFFRLLGNYSLVKKTGFSFSVVPMLHIFLKSFTVNKSSREADNRTYTRNQFFKKFDWGFCTGLGIKVPLWQNFVMSCEARYNLGMFQIVKDDISQERNWHEKTNSVNFLIGVTYRLCQRKSKE